MTNQDSNNSNQNPFQNPNNNNTAKPNRNKKEYPVMYSPMQKFGRPIHQHTNKDTSNSSQTIKQDRPLTSPTHTPRFNSRFDHSDPFKEWHSGGQFSALPNVGYTQAPGYHPPHDNQTGHAGGIPVGVQVGTFKGWQCCGVVNGRRCKNLAKTATGTGGIRHSDYEYPRK
jgi:hypothetical protein